MIALTLFALLDDQEDDSLASGCKVESLHIVIQLMFLENFSPLLYQMHSILLIIALAL